MFGQHDPGVDVKRHQRAHAPHRSTEIVNVLDKQWAPAARQIDRKETGAARHTVAAIIRHGKDGTRIANWWNAKGIPPYAVPVAAFAAAVAGSPREGNARA